MASLSPKPRYEQVVRTASPSISVRTQSVQAPNLLNGTEKVKWLFTVLICALIGLFIVNQYSAMAKVNLEIGRNQLQIQSLSTDNQSLRDQVAKLQSPQYLLKIAREKLHMIPANEQAAKGTNP